MAALDFDFQTPANRPGPWRISLLAVGAIALALSLYATQQARARHEASATALAAFEQAQQKRLPKRSRFSRVATAGELGETAKARVRANLDYSWQPAFAALAATRSKKIALLSLEASQAKNQLRLVAEARRLADAVEFANQLSQQPGVRRTALMQHEVEESGEEHPVRFTLVVDMAS